MRPRTLATALTALIAVAGCSSSYNTGIDKAAVEYDGYAFIRSDPNFVQCIPPGKAGRDGHSTIFHYYPVGQSYYEFSTASKADSPPLEVVSRDQVTMTVTGVAKFTLNQDCESLHQFDQAIGSRHQPVLDDNGNRTDNWGDLLDIEVGQPLEKSLDQASKKFGYQALYSDPATKTAWQLEVGKLMAQNMKAQNGGDYFCSPTYTAAKGQTCGDMTLTLQTPIPPSNLVDALTQKQQAILDNQSQQQRNTTQLTESDGLKHAMHNLGLKGVDGFRAYMLYLAIKEGDIPVIPEGSIVNVPPLAPKSTEPAK